MFQLWVFAPYALWIVFGVQALIIVLAVSQTFFFLRDDVNLALCTVWIVQTNNYAMNVLQECIYLIIRFVLHATFWIVINAKKKKIFVKFATVAIYYLKIKVFVFHALKIAQLVWVKQHALCVLSHIFCPIQVAFHVPLDAYNVSHN